MDLRPVRERSRAECFHETRRHFSIFVVLSLPAGADAPAQTAVLEAPAAPLGAAGGTVTITAPITYVGTPRALGWTVTLPRGWRSAGGKNAPGVAPTAGQTNALDRAHTTVPPSPARFSFRLTYAAAREGPQLIGGTVGHRENNPRRNMAAKALTLQRAAAEEASAPLRLVNSSTCVQVRAGANVLITGLVLRGEGTQRYVLQASGSALGAFGVPGALADPVLTVFDDARRVIFSNDNGDSMLTSVFSAVGAFAFPAGSRDSAVVLALYAGSSAIQISAAGGGASGSHGLSALRCRETTCGARSWATRG